MFLAATAGSCRGRDAIPRIGYAYPASPETSRIIGLLQAEIDAWQPRRVAEILPVGPRKGLTGYAADVDIAQSLVSRPDLAGVVGHLSSRSSLIVAPVYQDAGIPLIVPVGTSKRLRDVGPLVFSLAPDEEAEGEFITAFSVDGLGARRVTIFYLYGDEYGIGLRDGVVAGLARRQLAPVDQVGIQADSDFPNIVGASIKRTVPDVIVIAGRNIEAHGIASAVHRVLPGVPAVAGDGVILNAAYGKRLAGAAATFFAVAYWHPDLATDASRAFMARWRTGPGPAPTGSTIMFYDALKVLATAIRDMGPDSRAVRQYLSELGVTRPAYPAVSGPASFARNRPTNLLMTRFEGDAVVIASGR